MSKNFIMKKLSSANEKINELLINEDLQCNPNYENMLEQASKEYDYYKSMLK